MQWYSNRGYQWSLVEIQQTDDTSSLTINIHEGLVQTITIEYYTLSCKHFHDNLSMKTIEKYLDVRVGVPLNINYLQKKINYLKDNQLLGNIVYSIERSTKDLMSLDIKFQIQELRDKEVLIFGESVNKSSSIISQIYNLLGQYRNLFNWLSTCNITLLSTCKLKACYLNKGLDYQYRYINTFDMIELFAYLVCSRTLIASNYFNVQNLLNLTKISNLGFQLYLRNLSQTKSFCIFSMRLIQNELNIKISYLNPALVINQNFSFQFAIQIIQQYHSIFTDTQSAFSTKVDLAECIIESIFMYHFTSSFSISEKILLSRARHTESVFYNFENLSLCSENRNQVTYNYNTFKQNTKLFYQEFLTLLLSLRYKDFNYLGWHVKGHLFEIKSLYFTPFQKSNFAGYHFLNKYKKPFFHKVLLKQVSYFNLPIYFTTCLNHILVSTIKCQSNLSMDNTYLLLSYAPSQYMLNLSTKVRMEYLIPINNNIRVFLFYNYLDCFFLKSSKRLIHIWQYLRNHQQTQNFLLDKFSCGYGIQFKLPIKQMPPFSVEYTISSRNYFCIYLHTYYQQ